MSTYFVGSYNAIDGGLSNLLLGNFDILLADQWHYTWCVRPESRPAKHADTCILVNIDM